jgi:hypothetical protein
MVVKIWKVPRSRTSPEGIDYSLALISPQGERAVGYDNPWPKGRHRHVLGQEGPRRGKCTGRHFLGPLAIMNGLLASQPSQFVFGNSG